MALSYDGSVSSAANDVLSLVEVYSQRMVVGLVGLPAGQWLVESFTNSDVAADANWQRATGVTVGGAVWIRFASGLDPTVWGAWKQVSGAPFTGGTAGVRADWDPQVVPSGGLLTFSGGGTDDMETFAIGTTGDSVTLLKAGGYTVLVQFAVGVGSSNRWQMNVNGLPVGSVFGTNDSSNVDTVHEQQAVFSMGFGGAPGDVVTFMNVDSGGASATLVALGGSAGAGPSAGTLVMALAVLL
jgi:hypothetical protein